MSRREWRTVAREILPEMVEHRPKTLGDFFFDLRNTLKDSSTTPDLADKIWAFAAYCFQSDRHATVRASVIEDFYRHLATEPETAAELAARAANDLPRVMEALQAVLPEEELHLFEELARRTASIPADGSSNAV